MTYVSLGALKAAVGLKSDDTTDDGTLSSVLVRASAKVDSWLTLHRIGYHGIAGSSNSRTSVGSNTYLFDGTGDDTLFIGDFSSVASISVDGGAVDMTAVSVWPYNERVKRAVIYNQPISYPMRGLSPAIWWRGTANVAVTGFAGLADVPGDIEQATLAVAILYWKRYEQGEPEPSVNRRDVSGVQGYIESDPEVEGLLNSALQGWIMPGVFGG
jgi:hypothetical protein